MAKMHHTGPYKGTQRFWVQSLWKSAYAKDFSSFPPLFLSLSHIHIHQNHRKIKWNNQMKKKIRKLRPKVVFNLKPGPGCPASLPPRCLQHNVQRLFTWLEVA